MGKLLSYLAVVVVVVMTAGMVQAKEKQEGKAPDVEKMFAHKDTNGDGKLSLEEFLGKTPAEKAEKAKARFAKLDKDGSGDLSLEEFKAGMMHHEKKEKKEKGDNK